VSDKKKRRTIRNFVKNLSRGLVKSIPNWLGGALLEQVIYGTLDGEAAQEEAEKLHSALSQISKKLEGQDVGFADILNALQKETAFRDEVKTEMRLLRLVLNDPDNAAISDRLADAVERMFVHNLPYLSIGNLFKGREDVLEKLRSELAAGKATAITQVQAIHGLGGVGKTRLAVEYAWRALEEGRYWAAFFVTADTEAILNSHLAGLAAPHLLNLPQHKSREQPVIVQAVLGKLERLADWLLIIDNVDSKDTAEHLHKDVLARLAGGDVLITSRMSNWPDQVADLPIDKLTEVDAAAYLLEKTEGKRALSGEDEDLAGQVAHSLDGLPIALEQAASYINYRRIGFAAYQEDLAEATGRVLSWHKRELVNYPLAVVAAWRTTEERLGPCERSILRLASFLAAEPIPAGLFESQPGKIGKAAGLLVTGAGSRPKLDEPKSQLDVRDLLAELAEWSMIDLTEECFAMHRLVQDSIRLSIPQDNRKAWAKLAVGLLSDYIPSEPPPDDVRSWDLWGPIETHVAAAISHADRSGISEPTSRLMNELGLYLKTRARFAEAEPMYRRALAIDEKSFGKDHPNVAIRLNNLAQLFQDTDRLAEAEPLMRRALAIDEKSFGKDHPTVAIRLNNLAELLRATNRLKEAEPMYRRALAIDEKSFGEDHPTVAIHLNNLALLLQGTDRLAGAEPLMRRALAIDEKSFGKEHPNVARDLNNLAGLLGATNRLKEAEPMYRRALAIDEKSFGKEHPNVARDLNNLALLLQATNRLKEAEPMYRRVVQIFEKSLGSDHPNVATALNNLAQLLQDTDRLAEAEPLMRRALAIDEKSFGKDHPNVARDVNNLAGLLQATNRLKEAEPMYRRALAIDEKSFGKDHPTVARDVNNLAGLLEATNRVKQARALYERALGIFQKSLGPDHPDTQKVRGNLESLG